MQHSYNFQTTADRNLKNKNKQGYNHAQSEKPNYHSVCEKPVLKFPSNQTLKTFVKSENTFSSALNMCKSKK